MKIIKFVATLLVAFLSVQFVHAVELKALSVPVSQPVSVGGGGSGGGSSVSSPATLPIANIEMLRGYAWEQVQSVYAGLGAQSQINNPNPDRKSYIYEPYERDQFGTDPARIMGIVSSRTLALAVVSPRDYCYAYVGFNSVDGYRLFNAWSSYRIEKDGVGGYRIPKTALSPELEMADEIPLAFPGADSVRVLERNENGDIIRDFYLQRDERSGKFLFPAYFASDDCVAGEVVANYWDGENSSSRIFGLKTGEEVSAITVDDQLTVRDPATVAIRNGNEFGHIYVLVTNGIPPTIVATMEYAHLAQIVVAVPWPGSVSDNGFSPKEAPTGFWIRREGTFTPTYVPNDAATGGQYPEFQFETGTYYIVPIWPELKSQKHYWPPYDNYGYGKGG